MLLRSVYYTLKAQYLLIDIGKQGVEESSSSGRRGAASNFQDILEQIYGGEVVEADGGSWTNKLNLEQNRKPRGGEEYLIFFLLSSAFFT